MLIFFRYILQINKPIYAIIFGAPPVIPPLLNDFISKYIVSIALYDDPIPRLSYFNKILGFQISKNTYFLYLDTDYIIDDKEGIKLEKISKIDEISYEYGFLSLTEDKWYFHTIYNLINTKTLQIIFNLFNENEKGINKDGIQKFIQPFSFSSFFSFFH